jgi:hypothetical protein
MRVFVRAIARSATSRDLRVTLLRLVRLPDLLLVVERGGRDGAQLLLVRHVALGHLVEHGRQDIGEQAQLADLADRQGQSDAIASSVQPSATRRSIRAIGRPD